MADKYFDRREAEELLLTIAPWLEDARGEKQKIEAFKTELAQVASRIMVLGGLLLPSLICYERKPSTMRRLSAWWKSSTAFRKPGSW